MFDTTVYRFPRNKWPKMPPPLTREQADLADDWMQHWHQMLPKSFGLIEKFNHDYLLKHHPAGQIRMLEREAGIVAHGQREELSNKNIIPSRYARTSQRNCAAAFLRYR